ncbi:hypothetical protein BGZ80_009569 [Entomortierella chlamydospora]|uniref:Uncharacterized protein n=1 Tax=Entomortierella chlamydospora TaxID=101097 RepID=A0A9P6T0J2_9FUNG|nr:hypothetical protein BGZ80_009569 [Entomortierella chlamydospora]
MVWARYNTFQRQIMVLPHKVVEAGTVQVTVVWVNQRNNGYLSYRAIQNRYDFDVTISRPARLNTRAPVILAGSFLCSAEARKRSARIPVVGVGSQKDSCEEVSPVIATFFEIGDVTLAKVIKSQVDNKRDIER